MIRTHTLCASVLFVLLALSLGVSAANYTDVSWTRLFPPSSPFRRSHSGGFFGNDFVVFGGLDNSLFKPTTMAKYTYDDNKWVVNETSATVGTYASSYVQYGDFIVAYGGFLGGSRTSSTIFINVRTGAYEEVEGDSSEWTFDNPDDVLTHMASPCTDPVAVMDDADSMWIFGGLTSVTMLNQVTQVDLSTRTVYGISDDTSERPTRRYGAAAAYLKISGTRYMFIFGGLRQKSSSDTAETLDDEHLFNMDAKDWDDVSSVLGGSRSTPTKRAYASLVTFPNSTGMFLYGGSDHTGVSTVTYYDDAWFFQNEPGADEHDWIAVNFYGSTVPSARARIAADLGIKNGEVALTIHGGVVDGDATSNEVYKLTFDPCPFGSGNCFTDDPYRNETTTTTTGGGGGDGGAGGGGDGGAAGGEDDSGSLSTGLVSIGAASSLVPAMSAVYALF